MHTKESIAKIAQLLNPDGLAILSCRTLEPWFHDRLYKTIYAAIGYEPLDCFDKAVNNTMFVFGTAVQNGSLKIPAKIFETYQRITKHESSDKVRLLTDDSARFIRDTEFNRYTLPAYCIRDNFVCFISR